MLYNILIKPIEFIVEWVFTFILRRFDSFGVIFAVFGVSIVINFLALPLYNIADSLQEKERKISRFLEPRVKAIKKAFKGDEQFMMLQAYYRENNYNPLYVLRSSLSILIEIPFFIAAYHYLSHCELLLGESFWIFRDLGSPDRITSLSIFGNIFYINILPIIMTLINFVSGAIYTKDATAKEKIQLYGVAILFLILLYNSPSGLVIYWILNNIFSLIKNIVLKMKNPLRVVYLFFSAILIFISIYFWGFNPGTFIYKKVFISLVGLFFISLPLLYAIYNKQNFFIFKQFNKFIYNDASKTAKIFYLSCIGLWLLTGLLLPSSIISTSTIEFSFLGNTDSPFEYLKITLAFFFGLFVFWPILIYKMFGIRTKNCEMLFISIIFVFAILNAFIFKADYGNIDPSFAISELAIRMKISKYKLLLSIILHILFIFIYIFIINRNRSHFISLFILSIILVVFGFGIQKTLKIRNDYKIITLNDFKSSEKLDSEIEPIYHFSKNEKNVLVIFEDTAQSFLFPYILNQFPELKEQFSGFTYYPNCLSFGDHTVMGFPGLNGGYEYSVDRINARENDLLYEKHNEALLVLPKLFLDAGFDVTYTDPALPNYVWKGDLSLFEKYPDIKVSEVRGKFLNKYISERNLDSQTEADILCKKQISNFIILEIMFPGLRKMFYDVGDQSESLAIHNYLYEISNLYYLPECTDTNNDKPSLIYIENDTSHYSCYLENDFITPSSRKIDGLTGDYKTNNDIQYKDYLGTATALLNLGKYCEYLKKIGVYDNTRIIFVADHGFPMDFNVSIFNDFSDASIPCGANPLLMFKDFNASGKLKTDEQFMTNADTLFLAKQDLPISDINPFTGNKLVQKKDKVFTIVGHGTESNQDQMRDKTKFTINKAYEVHDDMRKPENWIPVGKNAKLTKEIK